MSPITFSRSVRDQLVSLDASDTQYATLFVEKLLSAACEFQTSDVHLQPTTDGLQVRWRLDGVLHELGTFSPGQTADIVTRLKVLAHLLTYRTEVPQEGRLQHGVSDVEMRISTFPTIFGERAVVRLFASRDQLKQIDELGLSPQLTDQLVETLSETSGAILITGPAGSGKTTTAYACLRHLVSTTQGGRSIVSLEDPVEVAVPGIAQSQVNPVAEFDHQSGLRNLLRQDPEVIFIGEIRDRATAEVAFQAALTGQLMLTTFHAGGAAETVSRLSDMGIEPYLLRSGVLGILSQRLVRRLCHCATWSSDEAATAGLPLEQAKLANGCQACQHSGYAGRLVVAEILCPRKSGIGRSMLARDDAESIEKLAIEAGMESIWVSALRHVRNGETSASELRRVMGSRRSQDDGNG